MNQTYITDENLTPVVQIIAWFCVITASLAWAVRAATNAALKRRLNLGDVLVSLALLFDIVSTVAISIGADNGYGKPMRTLTPTELGTQLKAEYAGNFFYIWSLTFSKSAVVSLVWSISPVRVDIIACRVLLVFIACWSFTSTFAVAFQCNVPQPWDYVDNKCFNRLAFWTYFETMNILTDAAIIALPCYILLGINASMKNRLSIALYFILRIFVLPAAIAKLVFLQRDLDTSDSSLNTWAIGLCNQIILCASVVATCVLWLKPFMQSVDHGFTRADDKRRRGQTDAYGNASVLSERGNSKVGVALPKWTPRKASSAGLPFSRSEERSSEGEQPLVQQTSLVRS